LKKIDSLKISPNITIKEALKILDVTSKQILLVVDNKGILLGTITDGDIRRAFISSLPFETQIDQIMNKQPLVAKSDTDSKEFIEILSSKKRKQLPIIDDEGYLKDIVFLEDLISKENNDIKVVLMAGGLGQRLRPLTNSTPKPMLKVGKYPILETIIRRFKKQGFNDYILALNYKKEVIQNYFQDGQMLDVNIKYIIEEKRLGTAGALSLIAENLKLPFILMNADILTNLDFNSLVERHIQSKACVTVCVRRYEYRIPYGVIEVKENQLKSITEKPIYEYLTNAGMYIMNPEILKYIPKNKFYDMPDLLNVLIAKSLDVNVCVVEDYWMDIGQIEDYKKANLDLEGDFND